MILTKISNNIDAIFGRLTRSRLSGYDYLQNSLLSTNVFNEKEYRRRFNGYYKMRSRKPDWYDYFFHALETHKYNKEITFQDILRQTFDKTGRVEASFSSKLIATIRPEMPVYDNFVRENMALVVPRQSEKPEVRVEKFVDAYDVLRNEMRGLIGQPLFSELRARFDLEFPEYLYFTDMKKLDLLLWQSR